MPYTTEQRSWLLKEYIKTKSAEWCSSTLCDGCARVSRWNVSREMDWPKRRIGMATTLSRLLTPMDFFFGGNVKDNVYGRHPTSTDDLKSFISDEFSNINSQRSLCENVCRSVMSRLRLCIDCQGSQFEQLLWKFLLQNFGFFVLPFWFGGKITSFVSVVIAVLFMLSPAFLCF